MASPMPKSFSFLKEKRDCSERGGGGGVGYVSCGDVYQNWRTFHRWGGLVFIVDVQPVGW